MKPIDMWIAVDEGGNGDLDTLSALKRDCRPVPKGGRIIRVRITEIVEDQ